MAVVMHLPDADLFEFAFQLRAMLKPGGTVILSLSEGRAVAADSRAADGRLFRERPPAELTLLFERLGFRLVVRGQESDSLGRSTLRWTTLVLRLDTAGSRPVDQIETIIFNNNDLWNLLPADARVNNAKRDRLVSRDTLAHSRDAIIASWRITRAAMPARLDLELNRTLFGRNHAEKQWEAPAFSALVEAVETVAIQRGVERWDPEGVGTGLGVKVSKNKESVLMDRAPIYAAPQAPPHSELETYDFADIRAEAFTRYLPLVGKLAAGVPFSGFDIADLDTAAGCRWVAVPEHLAGQNRFVVQIAGDSMAPELNVGDTVVFEYHRFPRAPDQIVIANLAESGISSDLTTEHAVKRLRQTPDHWIFHSTNPRYDDIRIPKTDCAYPILGIMVGKM